ncbi:MAG: hypothetical protein IJJ47_13730 [Methanosphaera sp.]|nr:hypothetical protein [Methanosphaera sp.]
MVSENWDEVVSRLENFDLNNLLNQDFLNDLNKIIGVDETISCVNISLIVRGNVINLENNNVEGITISCDKLVDTIVKTIYLNTEYKQNEIKQIIEKYDKIDER